MGLVVPDRTPVASSVHSSATGDHALPEYRYKVPVSCTYASVPARTDPGRSAAVRTGIGTPAGAVNCPDWVIVAELVAVMPAGTTARASSSAPGSDASDGAVGTAAAVPWMTPMIGFESPPSRLYSRCHR